MTISRPLSRLNCYIHRNGLWATFRRIFVAARHALFSNRMVLFYCDLGDQLLEVTDLPRTLRVEQKKSKAELSAEDLKAIISFWNPDLAERNLNERFDLEATLWLIKSEHALAGYGWTLRGRTVEPHYVQLGKDDIHFFDFYVFPQYRGNGFNWQLVRTILSHLGSECKGRAYIEAAEWNQ